jgi:excinuclease ABC subunit A
VCEDQAVKRVEISFLRDVKVTCEACKGARFDADTLEVRFKGRNAGEVLAMSVDEATDFCSVHPAIHPAPELLRDVGLGYLTLGQHFSGGEAQRINRERAFELPRRQGHKGRYAPKVKEPASPNG